MKNNLNYLDTDNNSEERSIRSYVFRKGRLSKAQSRGLELLSHQLSIPFQKKIIEQKDYFAKAQPLILEIGFGMGKITAQIAQQFLDHNFIGVEVYPPGIGNLLNLIEKDSITNLKIIQHDAVEVLQYMIAEQSLAGVHIFFPDPWPKLRHHKRRLIQPAFVELLVSRLQVGGYIHCATDWQNYAEQMLAVLSACPNLANSASITENNPGYAERPATRPVTKFEQRGLNLGHGIWDLLFTANAK